LTLKTKSTHKSDFEHVSELTVTVAQGLIYSVFGDKCYVGSNLIPLRLQKTDTINMSVMMYLDYILPLCLYRAPAAAILLSTKPTFTVTLLYSKNVKNQLQFRIFFCFSTHAITQEDSFVKSKALCYYC
jgi:hypothetical protein